jgi:NADP-dependent 3-hydroxy acid dehydrogenase YdfG
MSRLVWLVTGCSPGGFGELFVQHILARGDKVIATARNLKKIEHLAGADVTTLRLDITDSQQDVRAIITDAIKVYGRIDVLVNNAGYIVTGGWEDLEYDPRPRLQVYSCSCIPDPKTSKRNSTPTFSVSSK